MTKAFAALLVIACLALPAEAVTGQGMTPFVLGASTATAIALITVGPTSFLDIDISSGPAGTFFKCWDASTTAGLDLSTENGMVADFVLPADVTYYGVHYAERSPMARGIQFGLACAKSVAGAIAIVLWHN